METEGCDGSYSLVSQIEAYPKIKAEIGVSIGYKTLKEITALPGWDKNSDQDETLTAVDWEITPLSSLLIDIFPLPWLKSMPNIPLNSTASHLLSVD